MKGKKNFFKKIAIAMILAAMTVMNMAMPVFAEGETIDETTPVSLTLTKYVAGNGDGTTLDDEVTGKQQNVSGRDTMADVGFTVLKVATMGQTTNTNGNVSVTYSLTRDGATVLSNSETTYSEGQQVSIGALKNFIADKTARDAAFDGLADMTNAVTATTGNDGVVKFTSENVSETTSVKRIPGQGLYLVVETSAPDNVTRRTHPFFVSLPMSDRVTQDQWQYDVFAYPKNATGDIDFDKQILAVNGVKDQNKDNIADDGDSAEAYIGDVITYQIPYTMAIPSMGLTKLGIEDTMCKGLTFKTAGSTVSSADVVIQRVDVAGTVAQSNYTVTTDKIDATGETKIKIEFTKAYIQTLNNDLDHRLPEWKVEYKAVLNEYAVLGSTGNINTAHAYYRSGDMESTESDKTTDEKETTVYTWGIDLTKRGQGGEALEDVEFTLTNDEGKTYKFKHIEKGNNSYYVVSDESDATETLKTNSAGKLVIRGLKSDIYNLKETKTAPGYILLNDAVRIVISGNNTTGRATATINGTAVTTVTDTLNTGSQEALVPVTIVNNAGFILPSTGGIGTTVITMTGVVIVVISSFLLIRMAVKRRRKVSVE